MVDRIFAAIWLALTGLFAFVARDYAAQFSYEPIGPRAFPLLLAGISGACSLWLLLRPTSIAETLPGLPPGGLRKALILIVGIFAYAYLFELLGFPLATVLATLVIGRLFGGTWLQGTIAGVVMGAGLYLLFDRLLEVTLPLGSLWKA
jgi:putative tricarboxylic transport membrane protein